MKRTRPLGKVVGTGILALVTAPVWAPLAAAGFLIGYGMYQTGKIVVRHPGKILAGAGLCAALWYSGCIPQDFTKKVKESVVEGIEYHEQKEEISRRPKEPAEQSGNVFYYVKSGDTLSHIARAVSNDSSQYRAIAAENEMDDPSRITVGQLLKIPKDLIRIPNQDVYTEVPQLESIVLDGRVKISERFANHSAEVLELNRALGLDYQDSFPYKNGERIVWYTKEHTGLKSKEPPHER